MTMHVPWGQRMQGEEDSLNGEWASPDRAGPQTPDPGRSSSSSPDSIGPCSSQSLRAYIATY